MSNLSKLAPPARRGDFFYSSVLYADAGMAIIILAPALQN